MKRMLFIATVLFLGIAISGYAELSAQVSAQTVIATTKTTSPSSQTTPKKPLVYQGKTLRRFFQEEGLKSDNETIRNASASLLQTLDEYIKSM
jgi:hypothetical protein